MSIKSRPLGHHPASRAAHAFSKPQIGPGCVPEVAECAPNGLLTSLGEMMLSLLGESSQGRGQLEGPEEVVRLLEVRAASVDLVNQILRADDAELAESGLDDAVISQGDSLDKHKKRQDEKEGPSAIRKEEAVKEKSSATNATIHLSSFACRCAG